MIAQAFRSIDNEMETASNAPCADLMFSLRARTVPSNKYG
jgi:hypothetical protein